MICKGCGCFFCRDDLDFAPGSEPPPRRFCSPTCKSRARKRKAAQCSQERAELDQQAARCASQHKRKYRSKAAANRDRVLLNSRYPWMSRKGPYQCGDHWHLMTEPQPLSDLGGIR